MVGTYHQDMQSVSHPYTHTDTHILSLSLSKREEEEQKNAKGRKLGRVHSEETALSLPAAKPQDSVFCSSNHFVSVPAAAAAATL